MVDEKTGERAERIITRWNEMVQVIAVAGLLLSACGKAPACDRCDTLQIAATGEPTTLVPPLISETVGRDIGDLVFERLLVLREGGSPVDTAAYEPGLATQWERVDSLTWRFTLRPGARWSDGRPVEPDDVIFSFAAYTDTALGAPAGSSLNGVVVAPAGPGQVTLRFPRVYPELLFDGATQVRIFPKHLWAALPRSGWGSDSSLKRLVGSGRYRIVDWTRGQSLRLERVDSSGGGFRRVVWRFSEDQDAALNLVLSGEADLLETVTSPAARNRVAKDSNVALLRYPSAVYGFLGFRHADATGAAHPVLGDLAVRRALALAIDRPSAVHAVIGPDAAATPGPVSPASWIYGDSLGAPAFDPARARALLDSAGWREGADQIRHRGGRPLAVDILVPSTSSARKQLAETIQQMWKAVGVAATITGVDFPVFQQRLAQGRFDAMIGAWLDEPSPRNLADQWTSAGIGKLNYGRYRSARFDSSFAAASGTRDPVAARAGWQRAIRVLNDEAAAVFLYSPTNAAVLTRRLSGIELDPFSWLHQINAWSKIP